MRGRQKGRRKPIDEKSANEGRGCNDAASAQTKLFSSEHEKTTTTQRIFFWFPCCSRHYNDLAIDRHSPFPILKLSFGIISICHRLKNYHGCCQGLIALIEAERSVTFVLVRSSKSTTCFLIPYFSIMNIPLSSC